MLIHQAWVVLRNLHLQPAPQVILVEVVGRPDLRVTILQVTSGLNGGKKNIRPRLLTDQSNLKLT